MQMTRKMADEILIDVMSSDAADYPEDMTAAYELLSQYAGTGEVRENLRVIAEAAGTDFICALDDGSILVWSYERPEGRAVDHCDDPDGSTRYGAAIA